MQKRWVYIMTNVFNTTFYIGVTSDINKRVIEHKTQVKKSFSSKYKTIKLVYLEEYPDINQAIKREKQLKNWHRDWKVDLIKSINPTYKELEI